MLFGKQKSSHHRSWRGRKVLLLALSLCMVISAAHGQTNPPSSVRCPSPADPHKLYFECVGQPFDFIEETLTKDWARITNRTERTRDHADCVLHDQPHGQSRRRPVTGIHLRRNPAGLDILGPRQTPPTFPAFRSTSAAHGPRARTFRPTISATTFGCRAPTQLRAMAPITSPWARCTCSSNCLATH